MGAKGGRFMNGQRGRKVVVCFSMSWTLGGYEWRERVSASGEKGEESRCLFPHELASLGVTNGGKGSERERGRKVVVCFSLSLPLGLQLREGW